MAYENVPVRVEPEGAKLVIATGGELELQSGATLDVQSGATVALVVATGGEIELQSGATLDVQSGTDIALGLPSRFGLRWIAGQRGTPGLNGDIQNAAEATRMIADPDFEVLGTNAASANAAFNAEGGIVISTAGADADQIILTPHLDAGQTAWSAVTWGTDRSVIWEADIVLGASIAHTVMWAGLKLTNTPVIATDADQVFFRYENGVNSGYWQAVYSIGGTDVAADTGVLAAVSTQYRLKIAISAARIATFYINGVLVATSTALTDAIDLIPYIGVQEDGEAAAKSIAVRGQAISRAFA